MPISPVGTRVADRHHGRQGGRRRSAAGFSLLEILVVLTLMGLMLGLVGASLMRSGASAEIRAQSREIAAGLRYARTRAMVQKQPQTFEVNANERFWRAADRPARALPEEMDITLLTARSEITGENAGQIRFFPDGSSTGGRVTVSAGDLHRYIGVAWLTGKITLAADDERQ